jgi:hypothetical protein
MPSSVQPKSSINMTSPINMNYKMDDFFYAQDYFQYIFPTYGGEQKYDGDGKLINGNGYTEYYNIDPTSCSKVADILTTGNINCDAASLNYNGNVWQQYGDHCFTDKLCKNEQKMVDITTVQNMHNSSGERYLDTSVGYNYELIKTVNLGVGNLLLLSLIIYNII